jgi:hypothetical protein
MKRRTFWKQRLSSKYWEVHCVDQAIDDAVVEFSIEHPHLGQQKIALKLTEALGVDISAGGVRSMWLRNNMNTTALRVERPQALQ